MKRPAGSEKLIKKCRHGSRGQSALEGAEVGVSGVQRGRRFRTLEQTLRCPEQGETLLSNWVKDCPEEQRGERLSNTGMAAPSREVQHPQGTPGTLQKKGT